MSSTSSIAPDLHYLVAEGTEQLWLRLELWGGVWASLACRAWGREVMPGYLLAQSPWPPHSLKRTASGLGLGQPGSGRATGLGPRPLTRSPPCLGGPSPVPNVGKASSTPNGYRPMRRSANGGPALGGLQGWELGALAPVVLQEWMPQPCPHKWASEVALSTW